MRKTGQLLSWILVVMMVTGISCTSVRDDFTGKTEIAKWWGDKNAAISLTWDDGSINQFRIALPIMDSLDFPATFYIITGQIPGSQYKPEFVGRSMDEIISETEKIPTSPDNLFERASLAAYAPYRGLREYHTRAGELFESDRVEEACQEINRAFEMVRNGELKKTRKAEGYQPGEDEITWNEIQSIAREGHEFGSHTISHPRLSVLDEKNMLRELVKSREDILNFLGESHVFSAECPYGTEDERVMEYAHEIYPALRNRMPAGYLAELNRGSRDQPGSFHTEYVQWQRGPLSATPMELMKSWVDTCLVKDNIWLVLVFHGVEGVGWESKTRGELSEYFHFIKDHEEGLWVATFRDVTKYMRERMAATMEVIPEKEVVRINLTHSLDPNLYDYPLTLKTYIPESWTEVRAEQNGSAVSVQRMKDENGTYLLYNAIPNGGEIMISGG